MEPAIPDFDDVADLIIPSLGPAVFDSTLKRDSSHFTDDDARIMVYTRQDDLDRLNLEKCDPPMFELAGPRQKLFFNPSEINCGIVTCGGLCPGLNDVVRSITLCLLWQYGVKRVVGFRYGYEGLSSNARCTPMDLTAEAVDSIQHEGGTILGSSRGPQDAEDMVDQLVAQDIRVIFIIGGDGTLRGGQVLAECIQARGLAISVIGIPKTIDNDILCSERTFGFNTAVEEARVSISAAHEEAKSAWNGIGLVKLMGRDSGYISVGAALANSDVNFCLIPEVPFQMEGENGLLARLERRLERRQHAVIVVAEGAGQEIFAAESGQKDASGNARYQDIGLYLKQQIPEYFKKKNIAVSLKYIDPSYTIRSCPANASDSALCLLFGHNAVHAGLSGKTNMFIGYWNHHFIHVPFNMAVGKKKKVAPDGELWQTLQTILD